MKKTLILLFSLVLLCQCKQEKTFCIEGCVADADSCVLYLEHLSLGEGTVAIDSVPEPSVKHVQEQLERKEMQERLLQSIHALGEPDATILIQKYYYGRKMAAIGKMVGLTANAAQVRCSRALKRLQKELADWRD